MTEIDEFWVHADIEKYSDRYQASGTTDPDGLPMARLEDTHIQRFYDKGLLPSAVFEAIFEKKSKKGSRAKVGSRAARRAADALGDDDEDKASVAASDENEDEEEDPELEEEVEEEEEDENDYGDNYFDGGEDDGGEGGDALGGGGDEGEIFRCSNLKLSLTLPVRCDRWRNFRLIRRACILYCNANHFTHLHIQNNESFVVVFDSCPQRTPILFG